MKWRTRLISIASSVALMAGIGLASAAPAQAGTGNLTYTANCPGTARYQQLVIRNFTGGAQSVEAWSPIHYTRTLYVTNYSEAYGRQQTQTNGYGSTNWFTVMWSDQVTYKIYYWGYNELNFYYHVDCFY